MGIRFRLAAAALLVATALGAQEYTYFKQRVPLTLDPSTVAIEGAESPESLIKAAGLRGYLEGLAVDGWWLFSEANTSSTVRLESKSLSDHVIDLLRKADEQGELLVQSGIP